MRWRLRLVSLGLGGLGCSLWFGLGCPWKGVNVVLEILGIGSLDWFLWRVLGWLVKDSILGLVWLEGLDGVGLRKMLL